MKLEYDKDSDAAYIYLKERVTPGEVKQTVMLSSEINLDLDAKHKPVGIEILRASKTLSKSVISQQIKDSD